MLDAAIVGGTVVDGTGAPGYRAEVAIRDGRIVDLIEPGTIADGDARLTVDADGLVVAPGFIDVHTHVDAQVFWDPACTPLPQHGVTTAFAGNCGFSIAPLSPSSADYLMRMLARVEGIPLEALEAGVPWTWRTTADYLAAVQDVGPAVNLGFMVGHSAIRREVMGDAAVGEPADALQIEAMTALLRDGLAAGGFGFSSSWSTTHWDADGAPVPSRAATAEELVALSRVLADFPGTQLEFIPTADDFTDEHIEVMATMAIAAGRSLNWNVYIPRGTRPQSGRRKLSASDHAAARGAKVVALTYPDVMRIRMSFLGAGFDAIPGWAAVMALPPPEKMAALADHDVRARLLAGVESPGGANYRESVARWADMTIAETASPENREYEGRKVGDVARQRGQEPFDALLDVVIADELRTGLVPMPPADDDASLAMRIESWNDPRVVIGASDAGAHLDLLSTFDWAPRFLALARKHDAMPLEAAIHRLTGVQADLYGLADRGRVSVGAAADVVVLDPTRVEPGPVTWRNDLPAGAGRLTAEPEGIEHVLVAGVPVVRDATLTDARPGTVLRRAG